MYWKRAITMFSLMLIVASILSACGAATTTQPAATGGTTAATTAPAPAAAAVTIRWRNRPGDAAEQKVYDELNTLVNEKLKDKGITATYDPGVNQGYFEKLQTEMASGNAPDIFWIGGANLADFVNTGQILDLKPLIDKDSSFKIGDFYDNVIGAVSHEGKIYGLPRDISTLVTYYNEDMFKAAGLQTPKELAAAGKWDLNAMLDSAKKLTDPAKQQYGVGFGNWWGPQLYFVNAQGGSALTADRKGCALNTPEAVAGASYVQGLYTNKLVVPGDADGEALFSAGKVGMYLNGRWFAPGVRTNAKFAWDVSVMPKGKVDSTWLFWGPYLVNAKTVNSDAAWEVLKILTSADATGKVASLGTNIPPRKDDAAVKAFLGANPPANNQAYLDGIPYAALEGPVWDGNWGDFTTKMGSLWDKMTAGQITPEDFGKQACEQTADTFK